MPLEWVIGSENAKHAFITGLYYRIDLLKYKSQAVVNTESGECFNTITDAALALNKNYTVERERCLKATGRIQYPSIIVIPARKIK